MRRYHNRRAVILISALWIVAILTVFAVSAGTRSAVSLKVTSYNIDNLKAYFVARAGMLRALAEKGFEYTSGRPDTIDALSQRWANNKDLFHNHKLGSGAYTVGYLYNEEENAQKGPAMIYGLMDEASLININYAPKETIANLIESCGIERELAEEAAAAIIDWRDEDDSPTTSETGNFNGAEESYYRGLSPPYPCKNSKLDTVYEALLIKGVTPELFAQLRDYITVYGDGKVNINTAGIRVLDALFGPDFPKLGSKVIEYRRGNDEKIGTKDDRWFSFGPYMVDRRDEGLVEIKNLQDAEWYANIYGITTEEYNRIRQLFTGEGPQLCVTSNTYRVRVTGEVNRVKAKIEAVYLFGSKDKSPEIIFWYQE